MNREEFMRQLEVLLTGITANEKEEALQYYNDYFSDAGVENEAEVIKALGTPAKIAETIKADFCGKTQEHLEFTETGVKDSGNRDNEVLIREEKERQQNAGYQNNYQNTYQQNNGYQSGYGQNQNQIVPKKSNIGKVILILMIAILSSPIWLSFAGAVFSVVASGLVILAGGLLAFGIAAVALIIAGIAVFALAIVKLFVTPLLGILLMGISLLLVGFGILFTLGSIWVCGTLIPACVRGVVKVCRIPFAKKGGQYA